jgi:hypothetical protein
MKTPVSLTSSSICLRGAAFKEESAGFERSKNETILVMDLCGNIFEIKEMQIVMPERGASAGDAAPKKVHLVE